MGDGYVHLGDLWGWAGSFRLFVCGKFIGEPAPTGDLISDV